MSYGQSPQIPIDTVPIARDEVKPRMALGAYYERNEIHSCRDGEVDPHPLLPKLPTNYILKHVYQKLTVLTFAPTPLKV